MAPMTPRSRRLLWVLFGIMLVWNVFRIATATTSHPLWFTALGVVLPVVGLVVVEATYRRDQRQGSA